MDIFSPNFLNKSGQKHKSGRKVGSKKPSNLGLFWTSAHFPTFFLIICVNKIFIIYILIGVQKWVFGQRGFYGYFRVENICFNEIKKKEETQMKVYLVIEACGYDYEDGSEVIEGAYSNEQAAIDHMVDSIERYKQSRINRGN